jgi:hypothetical protein
MPFSFALALALAVRPGGEVTVRAVQGKIDITARNAVLADVLDRVAKQTGMVISYEGPPPRQLISLSLRGRAPADVVVQILEGQGLNYALVMDASATRVAKLLVTTAPAPTRAAASQASVKSAPAPVHIPASPPEEPPLEPPAEMEDPAAVPVEAPPPAEGLPPGAPGAGTPAPPPGAVMPTRPGPPPGTVPFMPPTTYSNSPFDPKPVTFGSPTPSPTPTPPPQP